MICPNCGYDTLDWYDGGEAYNYEAEDLVACPCGYVGERDRERAEEIDQELEEYLSRLVNDHLSKAGMR